MNCNETERLGTGTFNCARFSIRYPRVYRRPRGWGKTTVIFLVTINKLQNIYGPGVHTNFKNKILLYLPVFPLK